MNNITYTTPTTVYFGKGQIESLKNITQFGNNVLIIYSEVSIKQNDIYSKSISILKESNMNIFELSDIEPKPRIETVRKGVEICKNNNIDVILPIGRGSTIDCAKVIAAGAKYDGDAWDLIIDPSKTDDALPIMAILTLSPTGSETDPFAVISDISENEELAPSSEFMHLKMPILDHTCTFSVSKKQTATNTAGIIIRTLEKYLSNVQDIFIQSSLCEAILKTCFKYGLIAANDLENHQAHTNLMWASSSLAINKVLTLGNDVAWTVYPIEHELSTFYDITPGEGLAIITPIYMKKVLNENTVDKFANYGINVWNIDKALDKYEIANKAIEKTAQYFTEMGLPSTLNEVGITDDSNFEIMAKKVNSGIDGCYVPLSVEDIIDIFKTALK